MLLILEIGLAIAAWNRGWRGWALLPTAVTFIAAMIFTSIMVGSGASDEGIFAMGIVLDVISVITLIIMVARPRHRKLPPNFVQGNREVISDEAN